MAEFNKAAVNAIAAVVTRKIKADHTFKLTNTGVTFRGNFFRSLDRLVNESATMSETQIDYVANGFMEGLNKVNETRWRPPSSLEYLTIATYINSCEN